MRLIHFRHIRIGIGFTCGVRLFGNSQWLLGPPQVHLLALKGIAQLSHQDKIHVPNEADFSEDASDILLQINLRLKLDEIANIEAKALFAQARRTPAAKQLRELASRIYDARRAREKLLDRKLLGEPAWDMLLALFFMPARGEILSVTGLCYASAVPLTTALRQQTVLAAEGLIERGPQGEDHRRHIVRLTPRGRALMSNYLTRLFYCDTHSQTV